MKFTRSSEQRSKNFVKWLSPIWTEEVNMNVYWFFTTKSSTTCLREREREHPTFRMDEVQARKTLSWMIVCKTHAETNKIPASIKLKENEEESQSSSPCWSWQSEVFFCVKTSIDITLKTLSRALEHSLFRLSTFALRGFNKFHNQKQNRSTRFRQRCSRSLFQHSSSLWRFFDFPSRLRYLQLHSLLRRHHHQGCPWTFVPILLQVQKAVRPANVYRIKRWLCKDFPMVTFRLQLTQVLILATGISSVGRMQLDRPQLLLRDRKTLFGGKQFWRLLERMDREFVKQVKDKGGVFLWRNTRLSFVIRGTRPRRLAFTGEKWKHLTTANWTVSRNKHDLRRFFFWPWPFLRNENSSQCAEFYIRFKNLRRVLHHMFVKFVKFHFSNLSSIISIQHVVVMNVMLFEWWKPNFYVTKRRNAWCSGTEVDQLDYHAVKPFS